MFIIHTHIYIKRERERALGRKIKFLKENCKFH